MYNRTIIYRSSNKVPFPHVREVESSVDRSKDNTTSVSINHRCSVSYQLETSTLDAKYSVHINIRPAAVTALVRFTVVP